MKHTKTLLLSYLFYTISAFSISLSIKASVGISSFNALNMALSDASHIKVGTIATIINIVFLIAYIYMTDFKEKSKYLLQLVSVLMFGFLINFFTYTLVKDLVISTYFNRIMLMGIGTIFSGLSIGMIVNYGKITFPIESFCVALSDNKSLSFAKSRYSIDVIFITISLIVSVTFTLPFYVREGTVISLFLFTGSMSFIKSIYTKYKLQNA